MGDEKRIKQKKNSKIRKIWKTPTIRSTLKKDKLNYNIRSKKTNSITYHTLKNKMDQEIQSIRDELKILKDNTKHYDGKHAKQSLKRPKEEIIEELKKKREEEDQKKDENENENIFEQDIEEYKHPIYKIIDIDIEKKKHKIKESIMPEKYIKKD